MTIREQLFQAIDGIGPQTPLPRRLAVRDGRNELSLNLVGLDSLACAFDELVLSGPSLANAQIGRLQELSSNLAAKLTYLLEPIGPVEIDRDECFVQLRSTPPHADEQGTSYYEIVVRKGGQIAFHRYSAEQGAPRRRIPSQFTRETLGRLVTDLAAAM